MKSLYLSAVKYFRFVKHLSFVKHFNFVKHRYLWVICWLVLASLACSTLRAPGTPAPSPDVPFFTAIPGPTLTPFMTLTPTEAASATPSASPSANAFPTAPDPSGSGNQ